MGTPVVVESGVEYNQNQDEKKTAVQVQLDVNQNNDSPTKKLNLENVTESAQLKQDGENTGIVTFRNGSDNSNSSPEQRDSESPKKYKKANTMGSKSPKKKSALAK